MNDTDALLRGGLTIVLIIAFLGTWAWAWSKKRKKDFEEASRLPLEEDPAPPSTADGHKE